MVPIKKINNKPRDDIDKIDAQEKKEKIGMRGGMIELPNI